MSIPKGDKKIKIIILIAIAVVLGFFSVFGGLKLYALDESKSPLKIVKSHEYEEILARTAAGKDTMIGVEERSTPSAPVGMVIASKSGTKYHLPTCPGAKQIIPKNRLEFASQREAELAGYTPASTCPGLNTASKTN